MSRPHRTPPSRALAALAATALAIFGGARHAAPDDRDLLRFSTSQPYVFIQLDTSASMNLAPNNTWLPLGGDDPRSRLYSAKRVLYEVFETVDDVQFGFGTMNQDALGVRAKHWIYSAQNNSGLSIGYPEAGTLWVLGNHFGTDTGGSCDDPLNLTDPGGRMKADRFSKLGVGGLGPSFMWLTDGITKYFMTIADKAEKVGKPTLNVDLTLEHFDQDCGPLGKVEGPVTVTFKAEQQFLMSERDVGPGAAAVGSGLLTDEHLAGFWDWEDVENVAECAPDDNKRGGGWETNYDGTFMTPPTFVPGKSNLDPFGLCLDREDPDTCSNLKKATEVSPFGRALDRGDVLPFDWLQDNQQEFLRRLAPNHGNGPPDFGVATYFQDDPAADGYLRPKVPGWVPLIGAGVTPLGRMVGDFRCFMQGTSGNKCDDETLNPGWESVALNNDPEFGCRRPYQIMISDGLDTCGGPNPCSDTANLNSKTGVRTWVIAYGADCAKVGNPLQCMAENGKGQLVCPQNPASLRAELERILGQIREEARAFASAAAPSVEAVVEDKVFVSTFTPLNGQAIWDGHLDAFLKPLPLTIDGRPDRDAEQHIWDAGAILRDNQAPLPADADMGDLRLGDGTDQRRIFYSRMVDSSGDTVRAGAWPGVRRMLDQTADGTAAEVRYDLWEGLGIPYREDDPALVPEVDQAAQDRANQVLADLVAVKEDVLDDGTLVKWVLGDIFHSDPLVIGSPSNVSLFAEDNGNDGRDCAAGNPGYRCFFRKHQFRRKQLVVGANDGQLHVFDAGLPTGTLVDGELEVEFDNGSGHEIFAYAPRAALPTIRRQAEGTTHKFSVDGRPVAADVFIDPVFDGTPTKTQREFRSVVITGMREGGSAYVALDITQPDKLDVNGVPKPETEYVPSCFGSLDLDPTPVTDCGPLPYPSVLWEFDDSILTFDIDTGEEVYVPLDEDRNGLADLGDTWSPVGIGRIQVCDGIECDPAALNTDVRDLWVAVFGGGMDPENKTFDPRGADPPQACGALPSESPGHTLQGNWIYMVDIETGRVVYKRQLLGAAPAGAAAVDTDQDGYLDRIYQPTISGLLYRIDLTPSALGALPKLEDQRVRDLNGDLHTVRRIQCTQEIPAPDDADDDTIEIAFWEPRVIFSANFDRGSPTKTVRPLYHEPSVIFVAKLGLYAVSFGTGDREDLWSKGNPDGRLYLFVDDTTLPSVTLPLTEAGFEEIGPDDTLEDGDLLVAGLPGERGWFLTLDAGERVTNETFALAGVTFFATFQPDVIVEGSKDPLCSKTGNSRVFVVNTTNANTFLADADGGNTRYLEVSTFVTRPYTEQGLTKNPSGSGDDDGGGDGGSGGPSADELTDRLKAAMEEMKKLFPEECKFANYRIDIKTVASDTGVIFIAPVPVCLIEKNWKEF